MRRAMAIYYYIIITMYYVIKFTVYRLGGRCRIRVQPGERSEFQRSVRVLHENGALPQLRRDTVDLGRHTG